MKVLGKRSLASVLQFITTAAWYIQWVLLVFVLGVLLVVYTQKDHVDSDVDVTLVTPQKISEVAATDPAYWDVSLALNAGKLHYKTGIDWQLILFSISYILVSFGLTLTITYLLRKIFSTLTQGSPFIYENAVRIRKIALLIMLLAPLKFGEQVYNHLKASHYFTLAGERLATHLSFDFQTILFGLVLLIIGEIFRVGTQLKEENELTV
jgi:hypothetical protein